MRNPSRVYVVVGFVFVLAAQLQPALGADTSPAYPENWQKLPLGDLLTLGAKMRDAGGLTDAKQVLLAAGDKIDKIMVCNQAEPVARSILKDQTDAWLMEILVKQCRQDIGRCEPGGILWAVDVLTRGGKQAEGKEWIEAGVKKVKTVEGCYQFDQLARKLMPKDADAWTAQNILTLAKDDLAKCERGWGAWASQTVLQAGKAAEAKAILQMTAARLKTVEDCAGMDPVARNVLAKEADRWLADVLVTRCKGDFEKCSPDLVLWASRILSAGGKAPEAKGALEIEAGRAKTVAACVGMEATAGFVLAAGADKWLSDVLLGRCKEDLAKCDQGSAMWTAGVFHRAGKAGQAKEMLDLAATRTKTVEACAVLNELAQGVLGKKAAPWLSDVLLARCKDDFEKCNQGSALWAANVFFNAGKTAQASDMLQRAGHQAKTVQACVAMDGSARSILGKQAEAWLAGIVIKQCSGDLEHCDVGSACWAIDRLAISGNRKEARDLLESTSLRVKTVEGCLGLDEPARQTLGKQADAWLAQVLLTRCKGDFEKCRPDLVLWTAQILCSGGKAPEARQTLDIASSRAKTVSACQALEPASRTILPKEADKWLSQILLAGCKDDLVKCNQGQAIWAANVFFNAGKSAQASDMLQSAGHQTKTVQACVALDGSARSILGKQAEAWLAEVLLGGCKEDLAKCQTDVALWAIDRLSMGGKPAQAKELMATVASRAKTVAQCAALDARARNILKAGADAWLTQLILRQAKADLPKCDQSNALWAADVLAGAGKGQEARDILDSAALRAKTVESCTAIDPVARKVIGKQADAWLAQVLLTRCKGDFEKCRPDLVPWTAQILWSGGKGSEARQTLDFAASRAKTVSACQALEALSRTILPKEADKWLSQILLGGCKDDFGKCDQSQALWSASVFFNAGKTDQARQMLDAAALQVKTVQACAAMDGSARSILGKQAEAWLAGILVKQCGSDLERCDVGSASWAVDRLAKSGQNKEARDLLESASLRVKTVESCLTLDGPARVTLGKQADAWLAQLLVSRCKNDLTRCQRGFALWAVDRMADGGKKSQAKALLETTASATTTVQACVSLDTLSRKVLTRQADQWLSSVLLAGCKDDLAKCSQENALWAAHIFGAAGKADRAKEMLDLAASRVKTVEACAAIEPASRELLTSQADKWLSDVLLTRCRGDFEKCSQIRAAWVASVLANAGKAKDARGVLDAAASRLKTVADCMALESPARQAMPKDADRWLAQALLARCGSDIGKCQQWQALWACGVLHNGGKTVEARQTLEIAASRVKIVQDCVGLDGLARTVHAKQAEVWLSGLLLTRCRQDLATCKIDNALWAMDRLIAGGKTSEAKALLRRASGQAKTVDACYELDQRARKAMPAEADSFSAANLLGNCKEQLAHYQPRLGLWIVDVLTDAGDRPEALAALDVSAKEAKTVDACYGLSLRAAKLMPKDVLAWTARHLLSSCKDDLQKCERSWGIWATQVLAKAGKAKEAREVLNQTADKTKKVEEYAQLDPTARAVLGDKANAWLSERILSSCREDLKVSGESNVAYVARLCAQAGNVAQAKQVLDFLAERIATVSDCMKLEGDSASVQSRWSSDVWLAKTLLDRCGNDLDACGMGDAAWAARKLISAGQAKKARGIMESIEAGKRRLTRPPTLRWTEYGDVAGAFLALRQKDKAKTWTLKAYDSAVGTAEAREHADLNTVVGMDTYLKPLGLVGPGKGYNTCAAAMASMARRKLLGDGPHCTTSMALMAELLMTEQSREVLKAELTDDKGLVRMGVACILSWANTLSGQAPAWKKFLDGKIEATGSSGDVNAGWLLARAYAESARPMGFDAAAGKAWMMRAFAKARSVNVRIMVLRQIASGYASVFEANKAMALLDSVESQFGDSEASARSFATVRQELINWAHEYQGGLVQMEKDQHARLEASRRGVLEERLMSARGRGDKDEVKRYEELLKGSP